MKITNLFFSGLILSILTLTSCEKEKDCHEETKSECIDKTLINPSHNISTVSQPVCGCDGNTYDNSDIAMYIYGVTKFSLGSCEKEVAEDCIDSTLIDLDREWFTADGTNVCGCDGKTYYNGETAMHDFGVKEYTMGKCSESDEIIQPITFAKKK